MKNLFILLTTILILTSCATKKPTLLIDNDTYLLTEYAKSFGYGYSEDSPIEVGGIDKGEGPANQARYLNALTGPNGELVSYSREGSCCYTNSYPMPYMLDIYRVTWEGSKDTFSIYMDMYHYDGVRIIKRFKAKGADNGKPKV